MLKKISILISLLLLSACAIEPSDDENKTSDVPAPLMGVSMQTASPTAITPLPATDLKIQSGRASRYKQQDHGIATASGEIYDMFGLTAAHPTLPIGTYVRVTNSKQRSIVVRINDRNNDGKLLRLSHRAAKLLDVTANGGFVKIQPLQIKVK